MAYLLQPDRSGNPAVDALIGTAKKKAREKFVPVVIQLCVSGLRVRISVIHIITGVRILKIKYNIHKKDHIATQP